MTDHDAATDLTSAEAIVRSLADQEPLSLDGDCTLCRDGCPIEGEAHNDYCPYIRAVKWCEENPPMSEPTREQLLSEVKWLRGVMRSTANTLTSAVHDKTDVYKARIIVATITHTLNRVADESERSTGARQ